MKDRRFVQCDVFSSTSLKGNALAVVVDGDNLSDYRMQNFARWTNLAETTFLQKPTHGDADYRVRIFTPVREMPFAGHPTLGSCVAWLETGGRPKNTGRVIQQCQIGNIVIDLSTERPAFAAPTTQINPMRRKERSRIMNRLGLLEEQIVQSVELNNGPVWQVLELSSASEVLAVDSNAVKWPEFQAIGLIGKCAIGSETDYEVRMLAPSSGMSEDPITGSLNAAIAKWLQADNRLDGPICMAQGTNIERDGRVFIRPGIDEQIWIGGDVNIVIRGTVNL